MYILLYSPRVEEADKALQINSKKDNNPAQIYAVNFKLAIF